MTRRTKEVLAETRTFIAKATDRLAQDQVQSAPSAWEAIVKATQWGNFSPQLTRNMTYKGQAIPQRLPITIATTTAPTKPLALAPFRIRLRRRNASFACACTASSCARKLFSFLIASPP